MTIIEAALEKSKARRAMGLDGPNNPVRPELGQPPADVAPPAERARPAPAAQPPSTRIQPHPVTFEPRVLRNKRLFLDASTPEDRGTVAAYGMLRTRILHRMKAKKWDTLGVTSAAPRDGKSLTTLNLALSLTREKNNFVVLLDLDMRNPTVCATLGITPPQELREYFEGSVDSPADLFMSIGMDNLLVAGNVQPVQDSAELLASGRLETLLDFIRYNTINPLILIDLPPVLSPEDTLVVAPRISALLLVASEGVTARDELQKARDLLADFPVAGLVLNRATEIVQRYGYGYGYGGGNDSG